MSRFPNASSGVRMPAWPVQFGGISPCIRKALLVLFLALLGVCSPPCGLNAGAAPPPTRFSFVDPGAKSVFLAGEFNGWNTTATPLRAESAGRWAVELPLAPGRYQYKFVVDGRWATDPATGREQADDGFGGKNSVIVVVAASDTAATMERAAPGPSPSPDRAAENAAHGAPAGSRVWTTSSGQTFPAEFLRMNGANAVFLLRGREYPYPLLGLSRADQQLICDATSSASAPAAATRASAPAGPLSLAGQPLTDGESHEFDLPLTDPAATKTIRDAYAGRATTKARVRLALPRGFQPAAASYPLLIVSSTTDGVASSVSQAGLFLPKATDKGWLVVAVDGEFGRPQGEHDSLAFRWALVTAALEAMHKEWPRSKMWPLASGGLSGGGGYASHHALVLETRRAPFIGLFLGVSAHNPVQFTGDYKRTPYHPLHNLPIFMSVGEQDPIAKAEYTERSRARMANEGFRSLRYERFPGGHEMHTPHLDAALDWFVEYGKKTFPAAFAANGRAP